MPDRLKPLQEPVNTSRPIGSGVRIGHVHLKVADLAAPSPSTAASSVSS